MTDILRRIGVFTGTRAEYGLLTPIMQALHQDSNFSLELYVSGSHLDANYGNTIGEIQRDGFPIVFTLALDTIGNMMASDCGALTQKLGEFWKDPQCRPDAMIVLGDRYETLGVATATFLSNIPLIHIHGGDVVRGGMLDDPIRHAITKLAHLHFPITQTSADRILAMGEEPWRVTICGSPALDNIRMIERLEKSFFVTHYDLDPNKPWVLFTQHPITTEPEYAGEQARQTLSALASFGSSIEVIATYPNHDEGSMAIIECLEKEFAPLPQFHLHKSLGRINYLNLLQYATLVIGNSSSGLLETAHFKLPCINVGERQKGRERGGNVLDVPQDQAQIKAAIERVLFDDAFRASLQEGQHPFGEGRCAETVLETLRKVRNNKRLLQKQLTY